MAVDGAAAPRAELSNQVGLGLLKGWPRLEIVCGGRLCGWPRDGGGGGGEAANLEGDSVPDCAAASREPCAVDKCVLWGRVNACAHVLAQFRRVGVHQRAVCILGINPAQAHTTRQERGWGKGCVSECVYVCVSECGLVSVCVCE